MQLTCGCLNVKLHVREKDLNKPNFADISISNQNEEFFSEDLVEVQLESPGIKQEHTYLVHKHHIQGWVVHKCLSCDVYTHATPSMTGKSSVLLNRKLERDPMMIDRLSKSSNFSALYRIVLQNHDPPNLGALPDLNTGSYESLQSHLSLIQHQMSTYLLQEENNMEDRIRKFEEEQRAQFSDLQAKLRNEKKNIISLVIAGAQEAVMVPESHLSSDEITIPQSVPNLKPHQVVGYRASTGQMSTSHPHHLHRGLGVSQSLDPDQDTMFYLEDDPVEETDDKQFYLSDEDDDNHTDDSSQPDDAMMGPSLYATSVPLTVPVWTLPNLPGQAAMKNDMSPLDHESIGANMQALAQSVREDDRDLFGELPRPRLNTFSGRIKK